MKNKNIISLLLLVAMVSCSDFLTQTPTSDFTDEGETSAELVSKYANSTEAMAALNGAYENLKTDINQMEGYLLQDVRSDNCYLGSDDVAAEPYDYLTIDALTNKVALVWSQYYSIAGSATSVIENTRLMPEGSIMDDERQKIMAEGKFIRAYAYLDIVRYWGDAPMTNELLPTITSDNLEELYPIMYPPRSAVADIYEQIIKDLTESLPYLPSQGNGSKVATKGAANALLAKAYASMGTKATRDYNKVVEHCDQVIADGYELLSDYDALWNADNKFTSESILELYFTTEKPNWAYWVFLKDDDAGTVSWRRYCTPTHEFMNKYEPGDARKLATWTFREVPYQVWYPSMAYPLAYKIREKSSDIILIRFADILLLKAEALVELGNVADAVAILNMIRQRAAIVDWELDANMDVAKARLAVEKERQIELCMEAQRWFDLQRNERMIEVMTAHRGQDNKPFITIPVKDYMYLLSIPQGEMDLNKNLTQNPGY